MASRWLCVLAGLAGCDQVFQLERPGVPGCAEATFFAPQPLPGVDSTLPKYAPTIRGDELELFYVEYDPSPRIKITSRTTTSEPFSAVRTFELSAAAPADLDSAPSLTGDGNRIVFLSNRDRSAATNVPYEATRASKSEPFANLRPMPLFAGDNGIQSVDISFDGLTLYVVKDEPVSPDLDLRELWVTQRDTVDAPFLVEHLAFTAHVVSPARSPDGLELVFNREEDLNTSAAIRRLTRTTTDVEFDPGPMPTSPGEIVASGRDPSISATSTTLVYAVGNAVHAMHRTCD